eukprot:CAMPEP_0119010070 /NCGR_PEP_ID=MMETSP1176-20130426/4774_1 /TAXON_ID=265551 /ORGANISM="Synedropsis recta cf, Strain CCMP1620" /LENGTH=134 /DNA_ID=CAMNT_0006962675 /DNA_START=76 /DNA_END=480 /DNA_ORIENTATION=-
MAPHIDLRPYVRKRMAANAESPPPAEIVTEEQILQRGCPGAPRKQEPTSRKRSRHGEPHICLIMSMMGDKGVDRDGPVRMQPRQLFPASPTHVQDVPRPTPRRALPSRGYPPQNQSAPMQRHESPPTFSSIMKE